MRCSLLGLCAMAMAAVAMGAEKTGDRGTGTKPSAAAKTAPNLNLDGVWQGFVVEGKGEQPDRGTVHLELTIQGDRITAQRLDGGGSSLGQGTYRISPGRYYLIDATTARTRGKPQVYQGICTFGPNLMKWCTATPGTKRPTDFETKGQQFFLILKRQHQ